MASPADSPSPSQRTAPAWPLLVALLLVAAAGALQWNAAMVNDVAWQLWVARQLAHGITLYTDIIEVNPPLWFWAAIPVVNMAQLLGVSSYHVLVPTILALDILALLLVRRLCRDLQSGILIVLSFPVITLFAFLDVFGQREHLTLIAIVPYLVLVARRADGLSATRTIAILCGILAAFGIALKPHFLLVPVALEILLLVRTRRLPFRPESLALAGSLAAYALSVVLFASAYILTIVPMMTLAYHGYDQPILDQLHRPVVAMACLLLLTLPLYGWPKSLVAHAALVAGLAFLAAYLLQGKGWRYHGVPAMGCFALAIVAEAERFRWYAAALTQRAALVLAVGATLSLVPPLLEATRQGDRTAAFLATQDLKAGEVVGVLSTSGGRYWPIPEERHFVWPSRYMTYWMLIDAIDASRAGSPSPSLEALLHNVRRDAVDDLACHPPRRILEDRYNITFLKTGLVQFFSSDPHFASLMRAYRRGADYGEFATYELVGPIAYHPATCRSIY
jgi:hypothetical protein